MTQDEYFREAMRFCSESDVIAFEEYTNGLPQRLPSEPFHCGPHNLPALHFSFGEATETISVLELGFNLGHSAACMLGVGVLTVVSVEVRDDGRTREASRIISDEKGFKDRSRIHFLSTRDPALPSILAAERHALETSEGFDSAFVDAAHDEENVYADIALCRDLDIEAFLLDDWHPHWGPGVQAAARRHELVPIAVFGAMAYCVTKRNLILWDKE